MKKKKIKKADLINISKQPILKPINLSMIGTNGDPCFGKEYDLSSDDCRSCGDTELCALKFAKSLGKTRAELEATNQYKDLDIKIDKVAAKKYFRNLKRKGIEKKELLDKMQSKFELTRKEARLLFREFNQ